MRGLIETVKGKARKQSRAQLDSIETAQSKYRPRIMNHLRGNFNLMVGPRR
jgi:hypothetical protein